MYRSALLFMGSLMLMVIPVFLIGQAQEGAAPDAGKKKKGPGTPVVNMREMPRDVDLGIMEVFRTSLGVECAFCHVSGDRLEKGHIGDRQSDAAPHKLIARDMIRMTKEINLALTGVGVFPDPSNIVTCWTCHRGNRMPSAASSGATVVAPER